MTDKSIIMYTIGYGGISLGIKEHKESANPVLVIEPLVTGMEVGANNVPDELVDPDAQQTWVEFANLEGLEVMIERLETIRAYMKTLERYSA